ncbi:MAG: peptidase M23 [Micavibrio aeruginosavorus]|uniref:Peptidase M23 n=1 Tax=Micavibrio aeruginosavorus TaxID=349221 RepID=A0A2W4ZXX2_9BACT|nr:MAG: peptidase M23 [Micavibrio aeruginosavorus]
MKYTIAFIFLIFILSAPAMAQDDAEAVRPAVHPARQLEREKTEREARKSTLEKEAKKINAELEDTQKDLVGIAGEIKKNEAELNKLDLRIRDGRKEQFAIEKRLKKDKGAIGDLVLALERLNRTPPEAIIASPGAPLETAQSAMLLQGILPDIYGRAENLKKDLTRLSELIKQLQDDQEQAKKTGADLAEKQTKIAALLEKRKDLYARNRSDVKEEEAALKDISTRASNLKDLVSRIEEREKAAAEEERTRLASIERKARSLPKAQQKEIKQAALTASPSRTTPIPRPGSAQLPVSGMIKTGFRQMDDIGAESQGLTIESRPSGLVVAPMGGVVRYAGTFKNYGRIIIVEHQKEYHSLIAGLARIDTVVGQSVAAGEPVGVLPKTSSEGGRPTLYYELRLKGEPVNPAKKIAGL